MCIDSEGRIEVSRLDTVRNEFCCEDTGGERRRTGGRPRATCTYAREGSLVRALVEIQGYFSFTELPATLSDGTRRAAMTHRLVRPLSVLADEGLAPLAQDVIAEQERRRERRGLGDRVVATVELAGEPWPSLPPAPQRAFLAPRGKVWHLDGRRQQLKQAKGAQDVPIYETIHLVEGRLPCWLCCPRVRLPAPPTTTEAGRTIADEGQDTSSSARAGRPSSQTTA